MLSRHPPALSVEVFPLFEPPRTWAALTPLQVSALIAFQIFCGEYQGVLEVRVAQRTCLDCLATKLQRVPNPFVACIASLTNLLGAHIERGNSPFSTPATDSNPAMGIESCPVSLRPSGGSQPGGIRPEESVSSGADFMS